jgi:transposase
MPPIKSKLGKKIVHSQAREVISNVCKFMEAEKQGISIPLKQVKQRVVLATGVSERTIRRIQSEGVTVESGQSPHFTTPRKERQRKSTKSNLDDFDECVVRRTIYNFTVTEKTYPTLRKLHQILQSSIHFQGGLSCLRKVIRNLGFRWKKIRNKRSILQERQEIRAKRIEYLRKIKRFRAENRPIVYADETYIHTSHAIKKSWYDESGEGATVPINKGDRFIIVHGGSNQGFIDGALLVFKSRLKTGDFHGDMNSQNFEKWLIEKLIPGLPKNSVLVLDNAPYHNYQTEKLPTSHSKKSDLMQWLSDKNIPFTSNMFKPELYKLVQMNKPLHKTYKIDSILQNHGHTVIRLPPYHPDLNPIELIWAQLKQSVAKNNTTFRNTDIINLTIEACESIGKKQWTAVCEKVITIEDEYLEREVLIDEVQDTFVINLGEDIDDDDDDDEDDLSSEESADDGSDVSGVETMVDY